MTAINVEVKGLTKTFGKSKAVDNASFSFHSGHTYGFIGPNGAGKTTTMRVIATMASPTAGEVTINGVSVIDFPDTAREVIGFVPDSLPSIPNITVHEYIDFFARAYNLRGKERDAAVRGVEEFTGLDGFREKPLSALSKGMKQRVCLGRALVHDPPILILDEPAAGLDPRARIELRELIALLTKRKKAILISSHILTELTDICNGAIIIEKGRIVHCGDYQSVMARVPSPDAGSTVPGTSAPTATYVKLEIRTLSAPETLRRQMLTMPKIGDVDVVNNDLVVKFAGSDDDAAELLTTLVRDGFKIVEFRKRKSSLEDAFMSLTKGELQ